jgi:serine protease inhibitor
MQGTVNKCTQNFNLNNFREKTTNMTQDDNIKMDINKYCVRMQAGFIWLKIGPGDWLL